MVYDFYQTILSVVRNMHTTRRCGILHTCNIVHVAAVLSKDVWLTREKSCHRVTHAADQGEIYTINCLPYAWNKTILPYLFKNLIRKSLTKARCYWQPLEIPCYCFIVLGANLYTSNFSYGAKKTGTPSRFARLRQSSGSLIGRNARVKVSTITLNHFLKHRTDFVATNRKIHNP